MAMKNAFDAMEYIREHGNQVQINIAIEWHREMTKAGMSYPFIMERTGRLMGMAVAIKNENWEIF